MNYPRIIYINDAFQNITFEYATWLATLGFGTSLVYNYNHAVIDFFEWLQTKGIYQINIIHQKHIEQYFEYLQIRKNKRRSGALSITYLNHNFDAIDKLLEFLHQMGMSSAPIPTNFRIKQDKQTRIDKIEPFTRAEIKALQDNITNPKLYSVIYYSYAQKEKKQQTFKLLFALYYGCGLRRMEGYNLTVSDIDFEKKTIFIKQGKNYKDRIVPMNKSVYDTLQDYIYNFRNLRKENHKRLFVITTSQIAQILKDLQNVTPNMQPKRITLHILRHSIATHLLQNGMSIENIALFLGHTSLESTQIYTHLI